jgi:hypothetical protein
MDWSSKQTIVHANNTRRSVSVHRNLSRTWFEQSNNYSKSNRGRKFHRYHKYLLAVTILFANPSYAETVGGVSATANPVANSSGSVTNQAIQVLQGPYITNTYGGGIQCQGPTRNFTPYVTGSVSASKPFEGYYDDPVYDVTDNFGAFDADGNDIGDGILDNPGDVSFFKRTRTGQKDNYSLGVGFSMTWSTPTDKKLQDLCKQAATTQIELTSQIVANKRLDFEIARLKNCGELKLKGIQFHPRSPYFKVCADVVVNNPPGHKHPHVHAIPSVSRQTSKPESPLSSRAEDLGAPLGTE